MAFVKNMIIMLSVLLGIQFLYGQADTTRPDSLSALATTTVKVPDSILHKKFLPYYATIKTGPGSDTTTLKSSFFQRLQHEESTGLSKKGLFRIDVSHTFINKDISFYVLVGIILLLALIMYFFNDYFISFLQSFTNPDKRLTLTYENYSRGFFPSFLLNLLFVLCGGIFLAVLVQHNMSRFTFWESAGLAAIALSVIYAIKYLVIFVSGYLFNASYAARLYTQIVYTINKLIGILLIPLLWVILFSSNIDTDPIVKNMYSIFFVILIILIIYRYSVAFVLIKNNLKISLFHFFIYFCALEMLPVLIIFKYLKENFIALA